MSAEVQFKVCGITRAEDAGAAAAAGAAWLGFNLYPRSPRYLPVERYRALKASLPAVPRVAILVEPTDAELEAAREAGFDYFQVHFRPGEKGISPRGYAARVGTERLWLAPKLSPSVNVPPVLLAIAPTLLLDTFQADGFGGSGKTGDFAKFARHREAHPGTTWVLAGGLSPENIVGALEASGARIVDVNSGVESAPGVKDAAKLKRFADVLRAV